MKIAILLALVAALSVEAQELPPGKGKEVLAQVCSVCHEAEAVLVLHQSRQAWKDLVDDMVQKGADAKPDQLAVIVNYLATNFPGRANVNTDSAKDIAENLELTPAEGETIVKYRQDHGNFKDYDALAKVDGVDHAKLEAKKAQITF